MANKNTGIYGHFGTFSAVGQLPNVAGASLQTSELSVGDLASVGGALYICTAAALGGGVWVPVGSGGGTYLESGAWTPTIVDGAGTTTTLLDQPRFVRTGQSANGGAPGAGDVVNLTGVLSIVTTDGNVVDTALTDLPGVLEVPDGAACLLYPLVSAGALGGSLFASPTDGDTLTLASGAAVTGDTTVVVPFNITYLTAS